MFVLKKLKDNYILLGKEKPKDGDLVFNSEKNEVCNFVDLSEVGVGQGAFIKVIAAAKPPQVVHYKGVESNGEPIAMLKLHDIEKLLGIEEVKKLASEWALTNPDKSKTMETNSALNMGFIAGYKKREEDTFTIEDMRFCFQFANTFSSFDQFYKKYIVDAKTTWLVEVDLENNTVSVDTPLEIAEFFVPKITDGYINITKIAVKHPLYV